MQTTEPLFLTIGADPELFLEDQEGNLKSAIGRFGGTKQHPRPLMWGGYPRAGYFVQEDNVAVEFNIPPASELKEFVEAIEWSVKRISDEAAQQMLRPRLDASALFPSTELDCPAAMIFGCEPDFNAWNGGKVNPRPRCEPNNLRSAGAHIHVGVNKKTSILRMVKSMDLYLGVPSVLMDEDTKRRELYGKAGAFRRKPFGWEYRVLSNFWLKSRKHIEWAYEQTHRAVNFVLEQDASNFDAFCEEVGPDIIETINKSNPDKAARLCAHYNLVTV